MQHTPFNEFMGYTKNYVIAQPGEGTSVSPGTGNTMGSWVDLFGATLSDDAYGIYLKPSDGEVSGTARPILMDLGLDESGGSTYRMVVPQLAFSGPGNSGGVAWLGSGPMYLPLFIKAGSRVALRAQTPSSSAGFTVKAKVLQKPTHPELVRCGTKVEAIGVDGANSRGTAVTPGFNGAFGAWVSLGVSSFDGFYVFPRFSIDSANQINVDGLLDLAVGDATVKRIIANQRTGHSASEASSIRPITEAEFFHYVPAGTEFFARLADATTGTPDATQTVAAYVVGGG